MRNFCFGLVLVLFVSLVTPGMAADPDARSAYIVRFKAVAPLPEQGCHEAIVSLLQNTCKGNLPALKTVYKNPNLISLWIVNGAVIQATTAEVKEIRKLSNVASVKPSRYRIWVSPDIERSAVTPFDPKSVQWSIQKVNAPEVWSDLKIDGTGIVVGHLDTGIDAEHPALAGKVLAFRDFTAEPQTAPYDDQGHGTHTAGTIAGSDGVGVAPGVKLRVGKVFDKNGGAEDAPLLQAMQWVMDPDGVPETNDGPRLVSNSWGSDTTTDRTFWDAVQAWVSAGIVPVFAAGNNGPSGKVGTPAGYPNAWAVAATTKSDGLAYFSSVGPSVWDGITLVKPDIAAPGQSVISCAVGGGLVSNSGTSMACPHVAGLVALIRQADPALTIDQVRAVAESTAVDLGNPGKDTKFGSGRFNALACITKVLQGSSLHASYQAYESSLATERALIGVQAFSPLAGPLARSIIQRTCALDEGEIRELTDRLRTGSVTVKSLFREALRVRQAGVLNK